VKIQSPPTPTSYHFYSIVYYTNHQLHHNTIYWDNSSCQVCSASLDHVVDDKVFYLIIFPFWDAERGWGGGEARFYELFLLRNREEDDI
jgi:hypothetical protein